MRWNRAEFLTVLEPVLQAVAEGPLDDALAARLNADFGPGSAVFTTIAEACRAGVEDGWMGLQGDAQRRGGRVVEPGEASRGLSVDVVELADITGPHHRHPGGEVCAVLPETEGARFDGHAEGWCVFPPGSAHWPSASGGRLRVMFFLPDGAIEYTDAAATLGSGSGESA
jgi:hypothetical protein